MINLRKAFSAIEYAVFIAIFVAALISMSVYIKRAIMGRWREAADTFGHGRQYYPVNNPSCVEVAGNFGEDVYEPWVCSGWPSLDTCDLNSTTLYTCGVKAERTCIDVVPYGSYPEEVYPSCPILFGLNFYYHKVTCKRAYQTVCE